MWTISVLLIRRHCLQFVSITRAPCKGTSQTQMKTKKAKLFSKVYLPTSQRCISCSTKLELESRILSFLWQLTVRWHGGAPCSRPLHLLPKPQKRTVKLDPKHVCRALVSDVFCESKALGQSFLLAGHLSQFHGGGYYPPEEFQSSLFCLPWKWLFLHSQGGKKLQIVFYSKEPWFYALLAFTLRHQSDQYTA